MALVPNSRCARKPPRERSPTQECYGAVVRQYSWVPYDPYAYFTHRNIEVQYLQQLGFSFPKITHTKVWIIR